MREERANRAPAESADQPLGESGKARVLIGRDICPTGRNGPLFRDGNATSLFGDQLPHFVAADLVVVNLECPLIAETTPILKVGAVLSADRCSIWGIKAAGIHAVNLANNHILDHGASGLMSTIAACEAEGIARFGAGPGGCQPAPHPRDQRTQVSLLGGCGARVQRRWSGPAGSEPLGHPGLRAHDAVSVHDVRLPGRPGPRWLRGLSLSESEPTTDCRFMVEEGASAVVCQHSHCAGCYERYNGAPVVYGQGNLLFDSGSCRTGSWTEGFLLGLTFEKGTETRIDLIPYVQSGEQPGAQQVTGDRRDKLLSAIQARNDQIRDGDFVRRQWREWCQEHRYEYFGRIRNYGRLLRFLNKRFHFSDYIPTRKFWARLLNTVQCESHREVLETVLEQELPSTGPRRLSSSSLGRSER